MSSAGAGNRRGQRAGALGRRVDRRPHVGQDQRQERSTVDWPTMLSPIGMCSIGITPRRPRELLTLAKGRRGKVHAISPLDWQALSTISTAQVLGEPNKIVPRLACRNRRHIPRSTGGYDRSASRAASGAHVHNPVTPGDGA